MKKKDNIDKAIKAAKKLLEETIAKQRTRIDNNVTGIVLGHVFFSSLLLTLRRAPRLDIETMCTDGVHIFWNPFFVETMTDEEIRGVLVHEVMHCALGHLWRKPTAADHGVFNQAADYAINNYLDEYNKGVSPQQQLRLPEGGLIDHQFDGMSMEQIYAILIKRPPQKGGRGSGFVSEGEMMEPGQLPQKGSTSDPSQGGGSSGDDEGDGQGQGETVTEADWSNRVEQARQAARVMGHLPGGFDRLLGDALKPEVDWVSALSRFMDQVRKDDYSWAVPDRRFLRQGFYIPDLHSEGMGEISIIFDTSGSVDDALLRRFAGELQDVMNRMRPEKVNVIYCDAAVAGHEEFRPGDTLALHPKGGGGTDFAPAFNFVYEHCPETCVAVYFTDGWGSFPSKQPDFPVLWIDYGGSQNFPFGEVTRVTL